MTRKQPYAKHRNLTMLIDYSAKLSVDINVLIPKVVRRYDRQQVMIATAIIIAARHGLSLFQDPVMVSIVANANDAVVKPPPRPPPITRDPERVMRDRQPLTLERILRFRRVYKTWRSMKSKAKGEKEAADALR
ncbi:hypothetical protein QBC46DRAFT_412830 [Diplogelasinospora grovesii]|uniref:Uncharacterized protein n=1 Tax=Diplogelasinospora grovesii TaxID=303347 RepID=A0AAN6N0L9_9PEZI|nr:hypothetical protein QBC46DRAFT_412830 [Diplogelasinospora grovesii]